MILLAVGWYLRCSLSYRDVEELLGVAVGVAIQGRVAVSEGVTPTPEVPNDCRYWSNRGADAWKLSRFWPIQNCMVYINTLMMQRSWHVRSGRAANVDGSPQIRVAAGARGRISAVAAVVRLGTFLEAPDDIYALLTSFASLNQKASSFGDKAVPLTRKCPKPTRT